MTALRYFVFAFACIATSLSHAQGDPQDARAVVRAFEQAWNQHDMEALGALFRDDADFVNVEGSRWHGRTAIQEAHAFAHGTIFKQSRLTFDDSTAIQLGTDVVVTRSAWRLEGQVTMKGAPVPPRAGILTLVLVRAGSGC